MLRGLVVLRAVAKAGAALLALVLLVSCSSDPLASLDKDGKLEAGLVHTLQKVVWGQLYLEVDEEPGLFYFGQVHGRAKAGLTGAQVVAYSYVGQYLLEVDRVEVAADGSWGPLTVAHGPKILVVVDGAQVVGQWLAPTLFALEPLAAEPEPALFQVDPGATGLSALALFHAGQFQAAADVLARLQDIHRDNGGIPGQTDCFGHSDGEGIDIAATAWLGYVALELALASGQQALWDEALAYAGYLSQLPVPDQPEQRLAGWLLFNKLAQEVGGEYKSLSHWWEPAPSEEYCPWFGLYQVVSGGKPEPDHQYLPQEGERWLHYIVLAARGMEPEDLSSQVDNLVEWDTGGLAVAALSGGVSVRETAWMVLALTGAFR